MSQNQEPSTTTTSETPSPPPSDLQTAMNMADVIFRQVRQRPRAVFWDSIPSGVGTGAVAGVAVGLLGLAGRRVLKVDVNSAWDTLYTFGHVMVTGQASMFLGSLSGVHTQLQEMNTPANHVNSKLSLVARQAVCQDVLVQQALQQRHATTTRQVKEEDVIWYQPTSWVVHEFHQALQTCREMEQVEKMQKEKAEAEKLAPKAVVEKPSEPAAASRRRPWWQFWKPASDVE